MASIFVFDNVRQSQNSSNEALSNSSDHEALIVYPKEYLIYQDYLQAIGEGLSATPKFFDNGVIEATILSVTNSEICPSTTGEICNIEPYPNDYAVIKIDKVVSYSPYFEPTVSPLVEQPSGASAEEGSSISEYKGTDYLDQKTPEVVKLQERQNVSVHFTLTARSVKIRYVSVEPENSNFESQQLTSTDSNLTQTATHAIESEEKTFEPIPKEIG